jgi:hypothetical protein
MKWREEDQEALRELLNFFVAITQDKLAHVVLATADSFFPDWLQASACWRPRRARLRSARAMRGFNFARPARCGC